MKSILQNEKECIVCGEYTNLHMHHCLHGTANRVLAEQYGLKVWLCREHHFDLHNGDTELDSALKEFAQEGFEQQYPDLNFIKIFGKNYRR